MGLKTTNYEVKKLGITLPTAYAKISDIELKKGRATFVIQSSRENTDTLAPIETITVPVDFKRTENPFESAYNAVKGTKDVEVMNYETGELETISIPQIFNGWEDDIITE